MEHTISTCNACGGELFVIDALLTCSDCGIVSARSLDTRIQSFDSFSEQPSLYTRTYRFRTLCNELNGSTKFPDPLAKWMLANTRLLISPHKVKEALYADLNLRRYLNKIPAILIWAKAMKCPLSHSEIDRACLLFTRLDREISIRSQKKCAFTFLLPVVLRCIGKHLLANSALLKRPSKLLHKKYRACTEDAICALGFQVEDVLGSPS